MNSSNRTKLDTRIALAALAVCGLAIAVAQALATQAEAPAHSTPDLTELFRYEATGLSLLKPYERGKVPVVFVHGLWASPWSWHAMINALEADRTISGNYQLWTYGYSTGDPIPYTAHLFRRDLDEVRKRFDPNKSDAAFDRMVVIGHSMGGLLTKMIAVDPGDRLWSVVSERTFSDMKGEEDDRNVLRDGLLFGVRPEVRRVIYIATPHRGSHFDKGNLEQLGTRLVRVPDPLRAAHHRLVAENPPDFFREYFRKSVPSSIEELQWDSPILRGLSALSHSPAVKFHSIIAVRPGSPPEDRNDGLVSYDSAHLANAVSEKLVAANHHCQSHPDVIGEVRRILAEHAESQ